MMFQFIKVLICFFGRFLNLLLYGGRTYALLVFAEDWMKIGLLREWGKMGKGILYYFGKMFGLEVFY